MEWYLKAMRQYVDFEGRARRKEYWMYVLFQFLVIIAAALAGGALSMISPFLFLFLYTGAALIHVLPSLSAGVRRLHDTGKSGWWYLITIIPLIGPIVLLVWLCTDSQPGPNKWGPNPKEDNSAVDTRGMDDILDDF